MEAFSDSIKIRNSVMMSNRPSVPPKAKKVSQSFSDFHFLTEFTEIWSRTFELGNFSLAPSRAIVWQHGNLFTAHFHLLKLHCNGLASRSITSGVVLQLKPFLGTYVIEKCYYWLGFSPPPTGQFISPSPDKLSGGNYRINYSRRIKSHTREVETRFPLKVKLILYLTRAA